MEVFIDTTFEAAHKLPEVVPGHKCCRLHGHSFFVRCTFSGRTQEPEGWLTDFDELKLLVQTEIHGPLDHNYLNDVRGLENPTSENLAKWVWRAIQSARKGAPSSVKEGIFPPLTEVMVRESCTTGIVYRGDEE